MSLERKDVRFKLAPDAHAALTVLAELAGVEIGEFVELVVERELVRRIHDARLVAERTSRLTLGGHGWAASGEPGRDAK